jgi:IS30 family transposase
MRARQRAASTAKSPVGQDAQLRDEVKAKLTLEWSPQQIAAWLRATNPDRRSWYAYPETIYQGLYHGGKGGSIIARRSSSSEAGLGTGTVT